MQDILFHPSKAYAVTFNLRQMCREAIVALRPVKPLLLGGLAACLVACSSPAEHPVTATDSADSALDGNVQIIDCEGIGPVDFKVSEADLIARLGPSNVRRDSVFVEGEFGGWLSVIYPDTPREVLIYWQDLNPPLVTVQRLALRQSGSIYRLSNGIGVGTSVAELVRLNDGKPITFGGLGWDYGGGFDGFSEGKLKEQLSCLQAQFDLKPNAEGIDELMGEKEIHTDTLSAEQLNKVVIAELFINRPE
jgi:hypothetical protein